MAHSIGKITKYKDYVGEIVSKDGKYMFTADENINTFQEGDIVIFRAEKLYNVNIAHFVKKVKTINANKEKTK